MHAWDFHVPVVIGQRVVVVTATQAAAVTVAPTQAPIALQVRQPRPVAQESGTQFTKYLTTFLRLFYDNATVTIDLR